MRRSYRTLSRLLVALVAAVLVVPALAVAAPLPGDNFEADDGNLIVNTPGNLDWNSAAPRVDVDLPSNADDSFTNGAQENNPVQTWGITTAPVNAKADIIRTYTKSAGAFFRLGIVRNQQANGTVAYHVEFNQSTAKHPNGMPVRTVGDALIIYDFQGNNTQATLTLHRWIASGTCESNVTAPCWGTGTTLNANQAVGANNQASVTDTVADPDETLAAKTFDELAINIASALGLPQNTCIDFGQVSLRTREGGAFGSALQDLMGPLPIHVGNCDVAIEKDVVTVTGQSSLNPSSVPFNAVLEYRVRVFLGPNSSPVAANQLTVTDTSISDDLYVNTPLVPVRDGNGDIVGDTNKDDVLENGERWVYALTAAGAPVVLAATECADVVNSAKVAVTGGDTNPANNEATRTTPVTCVPDIAIEKTGPASVAYGDTITYAVNVSSVGDPKPIARADLHVTDPAVASAAELEFFAVKTGDTDTLLEKGEVWEYRLAGGGAVTLPANVCGPIDNTALVAAVSGETNTTNNSSSTSTTVVCTPDIAIDKTGPASVAYGDTITYAVNVSNVGDPLAIARADLNVTDPNVAGGASLQFFAVTTGDSDTLLEKGEVWEYRLAGGTALTLPADVCAAIDNTAIVDAVSGETDLTNNSDSVSTQVTCVPDLAIEKSGPAQVEKDATITYTVKVSSVGDPLPIARTDVHVTDPAVAGQAELEFFQVVTGDQDTLLEKGEVWEYRLAGGGAVTLPASTCGNIDNTALVAAVSGETNTANNSSMVTTFVRCPDYTVVKTADAASVPFSAGTVSWTVKVTNTGNVGLAMPSLTDTTVTLNGPTSSLGGADDPAAFEIGEVLTYAGTEQIAGRCGEIANTVSAAVQYGQIQITRQSTATTTVVCTPDIAIQKSGPQTVNFGDTITYTVNVTSVGDPLPIPRVDIVVTDPAVSADPLTFASETTGDGDTLLEPGESWLYDLDSAPVTLPANQCTPITNTAIVAQLQGETNTTNNQSTVTTNVVCAVNLTIAKTSDKQTYPAGETITYTVTVTNTGEATIPFAAIEVSDPTLPGLTLVGQAPASLAPGESVTYTGTRATTPADCGQVVNTATVGIAAETDIAPESTLADNTATRTVTVTCTTDLALVKSADKATYTPGETISYAVVVTNTGQAAIPFSAIRVSDPTLPGLTLVGPAPASLAPAASLTYTGSRVTSAADCGRVVNTASVSLVGDVPAESSTQNNNGSVTVTVSGGACSPTIVGEENTIIAIRKSGPKIGQVRRAVPYTIRVTNTGSIVAKSVVVTDPVPAGMTIAKKPANATIAKGRVVWSVGDLQPGQSMTLRLLLRTDVNATRTRCNVARASAANAPSVSSRACTRFVRIAGATRVPSVTG